jgi:hypothetical protein
LGPFGAGDVVVLHMKKCHNPHFFMAYDNRAIDLRFLEHKLIIQPRHEWIAYYVKVVKETSQQIVRSILYGTSRKHLLSVVVPYSTYPL